MKQVQNKNIVKFIEMVKDVRVCMFITREINVENVSGRPMAINKIDADGNMWFFTKTSSNKVGAIGETQKVSISIVHESSGIYLMIHGTSILSTNREQMKKLWSPIMKPWFPLGLDDPDMALIKVEPNEVIYWDSSSGKMTVLF